MSADSLLLDVGLPLATKIINLYFIYRFCLVKKSKPCENITDLGVGVGKGRLCCILSGGFKGLVTC